MLDVNPTFLVQLVIFLAVMTGLNFLVFRPLGKLHERRESAFNSLRGDVEALDRRKDESMAEYSKVLDGLRRDLLAYKGEIKLELDRDRAKIVEQSRHKAQLMLKREEEDLKAEVVAAKRHLDTQTRQIARAVFSSIVGRELGDKC